MHYSGANFSVKEFATISPPVPASRPDPGKASQKLNLLLKADLSGRKTDNSAKKRYRPTPHFLLNSAVRVSLQKKIRSAAGIEQHPASCRRGLMLREASRETA